MAKAKVEVGQYYYLTVTYNIPDLVLNERSRLVGPYKTSKGRDKSLMKELGRRYLDTDEIVHVTKLVINDNGYLVAEESFVASSENDYDGEGGEGGEGDGEGDGC